MPVKYVPRGGAMKKVAVKVAVAAKKPPLESSRNSPGGRIGQVRGTRPTTGGVTGAALAREVGLTPQAISWKLKRGMTADQIRGEYAKKKGLPPPLPAASSPSSPPRVLSITESFIDEDGEGSGGSGSVLKGRETEYAARGRKEIALANERELLVAQRQGELVPRVAVSQYISGMIVTAKNVLLRIGVEKQDDLAMETDPARCGEIVTKAVRKALEGLADYEG